MGLMAALALVVIPVIAKDHLRLTLRPCRDLPVAAETELVARDQRHRFPGDRRLLPLLFPLLFFFCRWRGRPAVRDRIRSAGRCAGCLSPVPPRSRSSGPLRLRRPQTRTSRRDIPRRPRCRHTRWACPRIVDGARPVEAKGAEVRGNKRPPRDQEERRIPQGRPRPRARHGWRAESDRACASSPDLPGIRVQQASGARGEPASFRSRGSPRGAFRTFDACMDGKNPAAGGRDCARGCSDSHSRDTRGGLRNWHGVCRHPL